MIYQVEFARTRRHAGQGVRVDANSPEEAVKEAKKATGYREVVKAYKMG